MVDDAQEDTEAWMAARSAPVKATYTTTGQDQADTDSSTPPPARGRRLPRRRRHEGRPHKQLRDDRRDQAGSWLATEIRREVHIPDDDRKLPGGHNWECVKKRTAAATPGQHSETLLAELPGRSDANKITRKTNLAENRE